jgi:parallel beta-helix repeat protein
MKSFFFLILIFLISDASLLPARIIYVPDDFPKIQGAINYVTDGDSVIVRPGTYLENIDFLGRAITVMSEQGSDVTIINGDQAGSVVSFTSGEGLGSVLDGFTLTSGYDSFGGGIYCEGTSPIIRNNVIVDNTVSTSGGGIMCKYSASPTIINNLVIRNSATSYGGGIHCYDHSTPLISSTTVSGNSANSGGGIGSRRSSYPSITNCIVWDHSPNQFHGLIQVTFSDVQGGRAGEGNIDTDPLFAGPTDSYFYLVQEATHPGFINPCVDAGDPDSSMIEGTTRIDGVQDTGVLDMGYHYLFELSEELPPRARFTWTPQYPDPHEPVYFDASGSYDGDGGAIVLYEWDWDSDGVYDDSYTDPTATHTWDIPDSHLVTLRVWDAEAEFDTFTVSLAIFPNPLYVPDDYLTIQEAIDMAVDWDTVIVRPGIYYDHEIDFLGKAITVMSTDPTDWEVVESTIVDANAEGSVFYFHNGEDTTSVLAGFTITGGLDNMGGGIWCRNSSSPIIARNVISGNSARDNGGGINCSTYSHPIITNNVITNNSVLNDYGVGGGICIYSERQVVIRNTIIIGNSVVSHGSGGGIWCYTTRLIIAGCIITGHSVMSGGGIYCDDIANVDVTNTILWGNDSGGYGDEIYIGGYLTGPSTLTISYSDVEGGQGSVFVENWCTLNWGDGMLDTIPSFKDDGMHLKNDSPLRNLGDPNYVPSEGETDIDNERRILEGRVDIGADEIQPFHIEDENPPIINTRKEARAIE